MSKIISTTVVNPNGTDDVCALVQVDGQELYYLLRPINSIGRYTISFFAKADANETIVVHYGEQSKQFAITPSWQRVVFSFTAEHIDNVMIQFTTGNYYLYNTQLENGDVATDYTLSPEDAEEQLKGIETNLTQMYSEVVQSLNSFKVEVGANYSTKESVKAELEVKIDKDDNDQVVSMINASADRIHLKSNEFSIESDYFTLKDGQINAIGGEIGGWEITETGISKETEAYIPPTNAHADKIRAFLLGQATLTDKELLYFDINGDGVVDLKDAYLVRNIARGDVNYSDCAGAIKSPLSISIDSTDGTETIKFVATNPLGETIESYMGIAQFKTLAVVGKSVYGEIVEGSTVQTKLGANLDAINEKVSNMCDASSFTETNKTFNVATGDEIVFVGVGSGASRVIVRVFSNSAFFYEVGATISAGAPVSSYTVGGGGLSLTLENGVLTATRGGPWSEIYYMHYHIGD